MASQQEIERRKQGQMSAKRWAEQQSKGRDRPHLKLPDGVEEYKLEPGTHRVDFLCYVAGEHNKRADAGFIHYEREYTGHRIEGPDGKSRLHCCRWDCFKQPCPACKLRNSRDIDKEVAKSLQPTTRHLWLVNDQPGKVKGVKPKVLDTGHFNRGVGFGELMIDAINICKGDPFAMQGGYTAVLTVKEQTAPFGKFNAVTRIDFEQRDYDYPEELVKKMPCLDAMLVDSGGKAMRELLEGGESEEDEAPASNSRGRSEDDSTDADDELDDEDGGTPRKATRIPEIDDDDEEDDEEESLPVKASKNGKPGKGKKQFTAADFGIKEGMTVMYEGERQTVIKVSGDGTSLTLEDEDENQTRGVGPEEVKLLTQKGKRAPVAEDDDEDADPPAKPQKGKKAQAVEDDDNFDEPEEDSDLEEDDEDDEEEDAITDDDEDEEEALPRKPAKKPARR